MGNIDDHREPMRAICVASPASFAADYKIVGITVVP